MVLTMGLLQRPIHQISSLSGFVGSRVNQGVRHGAGSQVQPRFPASSQGCQPRSAIACTALSVLAPAEGPAQHNVIGPAASPKVGAELGWPTDLDAHYIMGSFLGAGSYGVCHHATHVKSGRTYAIKALSKERPNAVRSRTIRRLRREAALLERLAGCGNVVQLVDKFESPDAVYFVLELCNGVDLQELLLERGSLNEPTAARVVYECLRVLKACHAAGVVHNDVKPGNFMVDVAALDGPCLNGWSGNCAPDVPVLKLLDFGCSQRLRPNGEPLSKRTGTPVYMSPETYCKQYTSSADVWSLGIMMHQCLTGRFPFWGSIKECLSSSISDVMNATLYADLDVSSAAFGHCFSPECVDLLSRMLVRDPAHRITVDEAMAHPWFKTFHCMCVEHDEQRPAPKHTHNIVPFPRSPEPATSSSSGSAELSADSSPVCVWAAMQGGQRFPLAM